MENNFFHKPCEQFFLDDEYYDHDEVHDKYKIKKYVHSERKYIDDRKHGVDHAFVDSKINCITSSLDSGEKVISGIELVEQTNDENLDLEFVDKYLEGRYFFFWDLTKNKNLTTEFLDKHMDQNWNYWELSKNPIVSLDFIIKKKERGVYWDYWELSKNLNITLEFIKNNINEFWDWELLSNRFKIDFEYPNNKNIFKNMIKDKKLFCPEKDQKQCYLLKLSEKVK